MRSRHNALRKGTDAKRENLPAVLAFVDEQLEATECPMCRLGMEGNR